MIIICRIKNTLNLFLNHVPIGNRDIPAVLTQKNPRITVAVSDRKVKQKHKKKPDFTK